ncbi:MAG: xanthine dehydrogenase family protein molybdopterin-binding subunit [Alphaproteobacteria bacterium]|nr:xanthine dehydrogenase family protein molybdopterin-binding subunit [Alphaproteobacteria bacterium]
MDSASPDLKVIGQRLARVDAKERVTGRAVYPADFILPRLAHGKIKRSPHAHARIVRVGVGKALAMKGVYAAISAADFPDIADGTTVQIGEGFADAAALAAVCMARGKVLWVGQPVAAVAASDPHVAAAALDLIEVEYEVLQPVMTIAEAMRPDAPLLHPDWYTKGVEPKPARPSNVGSRTVHARGDVTRGFAEADRVVERRYTVDTAHQGYIEPVAAVADVSPSGMTTVWASTQGSFMLELQLAAILGKPQSQLKVVPLEIGGGFGGKINAHVEPVAAKLAEKSGRPVKIVLSRAELMVATGPASSAEIEVKVGAKRDGRLTAIQARYLFDAGGFPGTPTTLPMQASANLYQCPNLLLEGFDVVTSKPKTEAYRAPGGPQAAYAVEQAMDELAGRLALDPLDFRRRNASTTGSPMVVGTPFPSIGLTTILERVAQHPCWTDKLPPGRHPRGRGLAIGYWRGTSMTSACHISLTGDARANVTVGAVDVAGTRTSMTQVAAEALGLDPAEVHVQTGDTKSVGFTNISAGSRVTRTMAAAVYDACGKIVDELKRRAAEQLQCAAADVIYAGKALHAGKIGGPSITLAALARASMLDGVIAAHGISTRLPLGVEIGAQVADVEVDPATGQVTILRYTAFQDVGRAVNPPSVEGQIQGSAAQGLGWALTEGFDYDREGRLRNANLLDYRLPTALDLPPIEVVLIETPVPGVPYGLRGVGEVPIVPPAAAVANAIARAIGRRVTAMPMTPERVVAALKGGGDGARRVTHDAS